MNASLIEQVITDQLPLAVYRHHSGWSDDAPTRAVMLSGSFRPLHRAHRALLNIGLQMAGAGYSPYFEISIRNVEKPDIAAEDLKSRLMQFKEPGDAVAITRAATFLEKARLMPGTMFVIGYDTAIRLFDDRFYTQTAGSSPSVEAMGEVRASGARFIVGGRHDAHGYFRTVEDIAIPAGFEDLLIGIPEAVFSDPISSTQIRRSESIAE